MVYINKSTLPHCTVHDIDNKYLPGKRTVKQYISTRRIARSVQVFIQFLPGETCLLQENDLPDLKHLEDFPPLHKKECLYAPLPVLVWERRGAADFPLLQIGKFPSFEMNAGSWPKAIQVSLISRDGAGDSQANFGLVKMNGKNNGVGLKDPIHKCQLGHVMVGATCHFGPFLCSCFSPNHNK